MELDGIATAVTGGASGLGLATARRLAARGSRVTVIDLPTSGGADVVARLGSAAQFAPADVTEPESLAAALDDADGLGGLRGVVHCAGGGGRTRIVEPDGSAGSIDAFESVVRLNLVGAFNVLRLAAERIARHDEVCGERGAIVLTASIAAFEGQIGQLGYSAAKAGIVGMTLAAARELAGRAIRVSTIAPGVMDTPLLAGVRDDVRTNLEASVPHPTRLGLPDEFAMLAEHVLANAYLNGETIRLDGALRMAAR
jgi:NAD(P)-dependent dehydrogenase (short-subunit alcohol dehydrogenase family)